MSRQAEALCALGDIRLLHGDYAGAADLFARAVDRAPASAEALGRLGNALSYTDSAADAEAVLTRALNADPAAARALATRGQVRAEMGEYGTALADLDRSLAVGLSRTRRMRGLPVPWHWRRWAEPARRSRNWRSRCPSNPAGVAPTCGPAGWRRYSAARPKRAPSSNVQYAPGLSFRRARAGSRGVRWPP
jgi:tetratricopeptide (TPR) repeat protein